MFRTLCKNSKFTRLSTPSIRNFSLSLSHPYALNRFPDQRPVGSGRARHRQKRVGQDSQLEAPTEPYDRSSSDHSKLWESARHAPNGDPEVGLQNLLANDVLVIERQIEMLNIFIGFEQTNKYSISNATGESLGYIVEETGSFLSSINRQILATHRPFKAVIMDPAGTPILWIRRPFAFINSRMYVQRLLDYDHNGEPVLDTFGEVQQIWHLWRRRYDLFLRQDTHRILSLASEPQPEPEPKVDTHTFSQIARVDQGFLAWDFSLQDAHAREIAFISRSFRGIGREIFTDTGQYYIRFGSRPAELLADSYSNPHQLKGIERELTMDEKALFLALAVNIDFDYFSRHSGGHG
ncbi:Scramblase-domain-containing protein [Dendrothele bispora CBS 962.96]|uniref:Phospholipid scramblase n=1 Tax=Dendrothele bispora (strain CBS 962.96) TaxID=1314807 RepID=A0A4S8MXT6_DENBC|nr:Scramblase-domain-containing protein [Dendrothele bispora CBS 962.96]